MSQTPRAVVSPSADRCRRVEDQQTSTFGLGGERSELPQLSCLIEHEASRRADISQKSSVASLRRSGWKAASETPHMPHKRKPSGFSAPQARHVHMARV
jgi:hypothetical protein